MECEQPRWVCMVLHVTRTEPCPSSRHYFATGPLSSTFLESIYFFYYLIPPLPSLSFPLWAIRRAFGTVANDFGAPITSTQPTSYFWTAVLEDSMHMTETYINYVLQLLCLLVCFFCLTASSRVQKLHLIICRRNQRVGKVLLLRGTIKQWGRGFGGCLTSIFFCGGGSLRGTAVGLNPNATVITVSVTHM